MYGSMLLSQPSKLIVNSIINAITLSFEGSNIYRSDGNSVYLVGGGGSIWGDTDIFVLRGTSAAYIVSPSGLVLNTSASILFGASAFSHGISIIDKAYFYSAGNLQRVTLGGTVELSVAHEATTVVFKGSDALWVVPSSDQTKIHKLSLVDFSLIEVFYGLSIQSFKHIVETTNYIFASCAAGIFSIKKSDSGTLFNSYSGLGTNPFLTAHNDKIYLSRHEAASIYVFDEELNLLDTLVTDPSPNQSIIFGSNLYVGCL